MIIWLPNLWICLPIHIILCKTETSRNILHIFDVGILYGVLIFIIPGKTCYPSLLLFVLLKMPEEIRPQAKIKIKYFCSWANISSASFVLGLFCTRTVLCWNISKSSVGWANGSKNCLILFHYYPPFTWVRRMGKRELWHSPASGVIYVTDSLHVLQNFPAWINLHLTWNSYLVFASKLYSV